MLYYVRFIFVTSGLSSNWNFLFDICVAGPYHLLTFDTGSSIFASKLDVGQLKMGCCVSTSSKSSCSSMSDGEIVSPPSCFEITMCGGQKRTKRTFSDHVSALQNISSIQNRIFTNGKSRSSCIFTQQGRKGINQDAMVVWEVSSLKKKRNICLCVIECLVMADCESLQDFMAEDVTFCGVFDGHGPYGHLVSRKVRDTLPLKLFSFLDSRESKKNKSSGAICCSQDSVSDGADYEVGINDKVDLLYKDAFLKSYKSMDKELRFHPSLDCFCSGSTAVTIVKQVPFYIMCNI